MKKQAPPATATGSAPNKFRAIRIGLIAEPDEWFNITDDLKANGKAEGYFRELARAITAGNRSQFKPPGAFEARSDGAAVWARCVNPDAAKAYDTSKGGQAAAEAEDD